MNPETSGDDRAPRALAGLEPEERRALLAQLLREKGRASVATYPTTYGQRALWYIQKLAPESTAYNIGVAARFEQPLEVDILQRALQTLIDQHAALRTTFIDGEHGPLQQVHGSADVAFTQIEAEQWDESRLDDEMTLALYRRFDLEKGPLMRAFLFARNPSSHVLLITFHHIISDGWSTALFLEELGRLYAAHVAGHAAHVAAPRHQYSDYAQWQIHMLAGPEGQRLRDFWLSRFGGELPQLDLPTDRPRPAIQSLSGASFEFVLDGETLHHLHDLAHAENTTPNVLFLSAFQALLHRYTGQDDIIVGTPLACRARPEFQRTLGFFANAMPLRASFADAPTVRTLLERTHMTVFEAIAHQEYPFALLVEQLKPHREAGRAPVFEVSFNYMHADMGLTHAIEYGNDAEAPPESGANGEQLHVDPFLPAQEAGQFDLALNLVEFGGALHCVISFSNILYDVTTIERMAGHYRALLAAMLADPDMQIDALPMLSDEELGQIACWNATSAPLPPHATLHEWISAQAAHTPTATALHDDTRTLTYAELDQSATELARHLRTLGLQPGALIGVYIERCVEMVVALLGVLKAGAAYVPLDPGFPPERIAMMLEDSAAPLVITQQALVGSLPASTAQLFCIDSEWPHEARDAEPEIAPADGEDRAYVIFTSGSTGRPKGVEIPHRAVVNLLASMLELPGMRSNDLLAAVTTLSFDIAVLELFLPLVAGAQVRILSRDTTANGALLAEALRTSNANVLQATPATWRMLLAAGWRAPQGFRALCGGEALAPALAHGLLDAGVELWNMYGPTETTVWSSVQPITRAAPSVVIGRPIANTQLHVLNQAMQPNPVGVVGELWIGGAGMARGYLNRPDLTAERFVADPFAANSAEALQRMPSPRLYRSGDLARRHADGTVEVLGRTDHQVKIRGYRIELGEVEVALMRHPAVADAVVVARDDGRGAQRLVAYLVGQDGAETEPPAAGMLRLHLRTTLPDYMMPSAFVVLAQLPRTPNGKVDRRALPTPEAGRARGDEPKALPTTSTERTVAEIWSELLGIAPVGVYDNFFDLGGHSLLAMEAISKQDQRLNAQLNPALFRTQTLGQVAASYDQLLAEAAQKGALAPPAQSAGDSQSEAQSNPLRDPEGGALPTAAEAPGRGGRLLEAMRRAVGGPKPGSSS